MSAILAFAEARGGELRSVALEAVSVARTLAGESASVHAILVGPPGVASRAMALGSAGADLVLVTEDEAFRHYNPEGTAALVAARLSSMDYRAAVFSASAMGKDLAPRVAGRLRVPLASDVTTVVADGAGFVVTHPACTGKVTVTARIEATPALLSVRPGAIGTSTYSRTTMVQKVAPAEGVAATRVTVTETLQGDTKKLDLAEAPVIVSGGRGLKASENFRLVEELAEAFGNAAVGATRAVTDEGWRPHSDQIGQTGRVVSPDLYVAVGISGAIQHLAGMRTSRTIVAINKDKEAPIFKVADYGIVGDVFEVVPALTAAVREARKGRG